jgi:hypothetical protein
MRGSRRASGVAVAAITVLTAPVAMAASGHHVVFSIEPAQIDESSSLVVSSTHPGLVYTANDSGDAATVYVLDDSTGALVGTTSIAGVYPLDIEAMTTGGDGSLIVADIGDNAEDRADVTVYRIDEPGAGTHTVTAESVRLAYATGPHNAEAVVYNDASGRLYIVTKEVAGAHVYRSPPDVFSRRHAVMKSVAPAPAIATDAALLPDGRVAVVRTYFSAYFYTFPGWHEIAERGLPNQRQGESVAVPPDGDALWIGSEGEHSRVLAVSVPSLASPTPPPPTTSAPTTTPSGDGGSTATPDQQTQLLQSRALAVGGAALGLLVLVAVVIAVRWHRHPHID